MVSNWRVSNQGPFAGPNGHPAAGVTASATVPTRSGTQQQAFLFVSLGAGSGNYVLMTASADPAQRNVPIDAIMGAFSSVAARTQPGAGQAGFQQTSSQQAGSQQAGSQHTWHMKLVKTDGAIGLDAMPQWGTAATPHKNVTIVSMLIPSDWTFQSGNGGSQQTDCDFNTGRLTLFATSPDKMSGLLVTPATDSVWSNDRGLLQSIQADNRQFHQQQNCVIEQPQELSAIIGARLKKIITTAQITGGMEPVPGLSNQLGSMLEPANRNLAQEAARGGKPAPRVSAEAGRIHFTNTDKDGTSEGYLYVLQTRRTDPLPSGGTLVTTDYPMQYITGAPAGRLAAMEPMFQAMVGSIKIDPEYLAEMAQVAANRMQIREITKRKLSQIAANIAADNAHAAAQQSAIMSGLSSYRSQVMSNVAANRSAALSHSSQQFSLYMGDQAIYKDTSTGHSVQLPSGADHVWASSTGNTNDYILTNSPSYNPNGQAGSGGWTQMQMQR